MSVGGRRANETWRLSWGGGTAETVAALARLLSNRRMIPLGIVSVGFVARIITALRADLHPDETYDLFAARMIWDHGIPIFPSGMLWTTGGPLTYVEAPFVAVFGDTSHWARLPSVLVSTASIWMLYRLGERTVGWAAAGVAALAWALDPDAVLWGAYARQYSLHPLALFATLFLLREAARRGCAGHTGLTAAAAFVITAWIHPPTFFFIPGLTVAYFLWMEKCALRRMAAAAAFGALGSAAVMALVSLGDPGLLQSAAAEGGAIVVPPITVVGLEAMASRYLPFLTAYPHRTLLLVLAVLVAGMAAWTSTPLADRDGGLVRERRNVLALGVSALLSFIALGFFRFQQPGYGLAILGPVFLVGASGLMSIVYGLWHSAQTAAPTRGGAEQTWPAVPATAVLPALVVVSVLMLQILPILRHNGAPGAGDGQIQAYRFVGKHWQPGDAMLNANITAWVVAGADPHFYYLCVDTCGLGLTKTDRGYVNRFLGSPQVRTRDEVERILDQYLRVWFVIKQSDWEDDRRFPLAIRELINARMDIVFRLNLATVFLSRGG